jgi:hypothetical protein
MCFIKIRNAALLFTDIPHYSMINSELQSNLKMSVWAFFRRGVWWKTTNRHDFYAKIAFENIGIPQKKRPASAGNWAK